MRFRLDTPVGFHLPATVLSHGWYQLAPFQWNPERKSLSHVSVIGGEPVRVVLRQPSETLVVETSPSRSRSDVAELVGRMLQLHVDLREFHELCLQSSVLRDLPTSGVGRLLCAPSLFEDTVKIILTTNTRWSRTRVMNRLIVEHYGRRTPTGEPAFPLPEDIANGSELVLRESCRLGYRARSVHRLALAVASGEIDLTTRPAPDSSPYELLHDWYLQLPGIGPYGAAHLMAMEGRHDRIAVDTEFRAWVRERYHGGRQVRDQTMLRHYRQWGRWKYLAYWCEVLLHDR